MTRSTTAGRMRSPAGFEAEVDTNPLRDPRDKRLPRIAGPCSVVIFGVTGDLSRKKLMPAIYDLANRGLLPPGFSLVGFARRDWANEDFATVVHDGGQGSSPAHRSRRTCGGTLAEGFRFVPGTFDDDDAFDALSQTVAELDEVRGTGGNHAFYLSIPPGAFPVVLKQLRRSGVVRPAAGRPWRRVVIEKPFGHDLTSARELNALVGDVFPTETRVPDRPLPRQGDGAEHLGAALRQPAVRADLECATTSTTSRSPWPRTSASAAGPATTTGSAPPGTSSRTTCSSSWP
jgi:glucose-6-phosphate 1-dehydrogenase